VKGPLVEVDVPDQARTFRVALGNLKNGHIAISVSTEHKRSPSDGTVAASQDSMSTDDR
jgi:hypothetical protein